jgi:hypothetical protein
VETTLDEDGLPDRKTTDGNGETTDGDGTTTDGSGETTDGNGTL